MKTILTALIIFSFVYFSCGDSNKNNGSGNTNNTPNTNTTTTNEPPKTEANTIKKQTPQTELKNTGGAIRVEFPKGSTQVTLNGNIKGLSDNVTYVFEVSKGQTLIASLRPSPMIDANLRFNQLFSPSGKIDGPFGNELKESLTESGDWKLVVGESNMEGTPYIGEFLLTISIK